MGVPERATDQEEGAPDRRPFLQRTCVVEPDLQVAPSSAVLDPLRHLVSQNDTCRRLARLHNDLNLHRLEWTSVARRPVGIRHAGRGGWLAVTS